MLFPVKSSHMLVTTFSNNVARKKYQIITTFKEKLIERLAFSAHAVTIFAQNGHFNIFFYKIVNSCFIPNEFTVLLSVKIAIRLFN